MAKIMSKICWLHSFPLDVQHSGIFVYYAYKTLKRYIDVDLVYTPSFRSLPTMSDQIRDLRSGIYSLVHAQYGAGCAYVGSFATVPKVLSLRGSDWYGCETGNTIMRLHGRLSSFFSRISLCSYDAITVVSERMQRDVVPVAKAPVFVIPTPVDLTKFYPISRTEARERLGYKNDQSPWVLFSTVKRNNPIKRVELAFAAVERVRKSIPNVQFKVMSGVARELVPLMINASDVVLLTSIHEGWPNIIKESLACNIPFVSTDVSDLRKIADVESSCHVVEAHPDVLASAIVDVLNEKSVTDLRRFVIDMDMNLFPKKIINLYKNIIGDVVN